MAKIEIRRRSIERYIECKSESMHGYLSDKGGPLFAALQRVAMLYQMTDDNEEARSAVAANFEPLFTELNDNVDEFRRIARAMKREYQKVISRLPKNSNVVTPEYFTHQVPLTHRIHHQVIEKLEIIDGLLSRIEVYWIYGVISDSQMRHARAQGLKGFGTLNNKIFEITNKINRVEAKGRARDRIRHQIHTELGEEKTEVVAEAVSEEAEAETAEGAKAHSVLVPDSDDWTPPADLTPDLPGETEALAASGQN